MISTLKQAAIRIAPGEPVPPGFEGEVKPVAQLQPSLDKHISTALVGLEYIVEMSVRQGNEASYRCILCDRNYYRNYDNKTIMTHILSDDHRTVFLNRHFSTAMRELAPYRDNKSIKNILSGVIDALCSAIEDTYGRMSPNIYEMTDFLENREKYTKKIFDDKHFDEKSGKIFTDMIDHKSLGREVKKYSARTINESTHNNKKEASKHHSSTTTNAQYESSVEQISDAELKHKQFRFMVDAAVCDLDRLFHKYESRPESHPQYSAEWKLFWADRCEQLRQKNIDPNKYNFSTEWSKFWLRRLKELYEDELLYQKRQLKKKLNIRPLTSEEPTAYVRSTTPERIQQLPINLDENDNEGASIGTHGQNFGRCSIVDHVVNDNMTRKTFHDNYDDFSEDVYEVTSSTKRSLNELDRVSPTSMDRYEDQYHDKQRQSPLKKRQRVYSPHLTNMSNDSDIDDIEEDENVNFDPNITVIGVLRILTVFEDYLGSLGTKVIDLLSKAVALEKVKPNLADDLLLNEENSILLETCKEKLTGQILAGVLDKIKVKGVKKVIANIKSIVKNIDKKLKENKNTSGQTSLPAESIQNKQQESVDLKSVEMDSILSSDIFKRIVSNINNKNVDQEKSENSGDGNQSKQMFYNNVQSDQYQLTSNQIGSNSSNYNHQFQHQLLSQQDNCIRPGNCLTKNNETKIQAISSTVPAQKLLESNYPVFQTNNTQRKINFEFQFASNQPNCTETQYNNSQQSNSDNYNRIQSNQHYQQHCNTQNNQGQQQSMFSNANSQNRQNKNQHGRGNSGNKNQDCTQGGRGNNNHRGGGNNKRGRGQSSGMKNQGRGQGSVNNKHGRGQFSGRNNNNNRAGNISNFGGGGNNQGGNGQQFFGGSVRGQQFYGGGGGQEGGYGGAQNTWGGQCGSSGFNNGGGREPNSFQGNINRGGGTNRW